MSAEEKAEKFKAAQESRKAALLALAEDRPAHRLYIEALLAVEDEDDVIDVKPPKGVSGRVAEAILDDVFWIRQKPPTKGFPSQFPNSYSERRRTDARAAAERERTKNSLGSLLGLGGDE